MISPLTMVVRMTIMIMTNLLMTSAIPIPLKMVESKIDSNISWFCKCRTRKDGNACWSWIRHCWCWIRRRWTDDDDDSCINRSCLWSFCIGEDDKEVELDDARMMMMMHGWWRGFLCKAVVSLAAAVSTSIFPARKISNSTTADSKYLDNWSE